MSASIGGTPLPRPSEAEARVIEREMGLAPSTWPENGLSWEDHQRLRALRPCLSRARSRVFCTCYYCSLP
jgi:hypothetical protein